MTTIVQQIHLCVPKDAELPTNIYNLTPEEVAMVLTIGCQILDLAKTRIYEHSHAEIACQIEQKYAGTMQELADLRRENGQLEKDKQISIDNITQTMRGIMNSDREILQDRIKFLENEFIRLRSTQNDEYKNVFEKTVEKIDKIAIIQNIQGNKSSVSLGKIGETKFAELANSVFRDYESFEFVDVHSFAGYGDYHLRFKDFTVLADSKQYSNKVNATSRDKIKRDLLQNNVDFAWLISMDTTIDKYDKYDFMFEWVSDKKCICYVNSLMKHENPGETLRTVWYCCKLLYDHVLKTNSMDNMVDKYRDFQLKMKELGERMKRNSRERETIMTQLRANFDRNDEIVREIVNDETNHLTSNFAVVMEWWSQNVETCVDSQIKSTQLWSKFKKDRPNSEITTIMFKDAICAIVPDNQMDKPKTKGGSILVHNIRWKSDVIEVDTKIDIPDGMNV